jgi:hypothetical protein
MSKIFVRKYVSLSVKFTTVLARPRVLRGKCFRDFKRVKSNTSNLRCTLNFQLKKCEKKGSL